LLAGFAASDITPGKSYDASSMAAAIKKRHPLFLLLLLVLSLVSFAD